ncbi:MAG: DUF2339 domain-containing protein [Phycisphaerales bacterium]|nr:DUF2339 domain-containing protein [Phycisphaerales bacterium]
MHDDQRKQIERLQSTVDQLSKQVEELTKRLDTHLKPSATDSTSSTPAFLSPANKSAQQPTQQTAQQPSQSKPLVKPVPKPLPKLTPAPTKKPKPQRPAFDPSKFEWILGIKGLMLLGVIVIVVGVAMFLKLAVDEGWIAAISPAMRCLSTAIFGGILIALGEYLRKKINPLASSGFTAAGIATIYASILASTKMFDLIDTPIAFLLLFAVTVIGIYLGSLSNRVMLSLLSLIGAFAVPILLSTGQGSRVVLPLYLLSLLTIGLTLSAWKGGRYAYVRQLAWWGTGIVGTAWITKMHADAPVNTLAFIAAVWTMTVAELAASARFFKALRDKHNWSNTSQAGFIRANNNENNSSEIKFNPLALLTPSSRWINALFAVTIWSTISAGITLTQINPTYDFFAPLTLAIMSTLIVVLSRFTKLDLTKHLVSDTASPMSLFSAALIINAAMLTVATIAVALGGWLQVLAWILVGLAATETARRFRFRAVGIFALALITVALSRLLTHDLARSIDTTPTLNILGLAATGWTLQMLLATAALIAAWWRSRYAPERSIALSTAIWIASLALIHEQSEIFAIGPAWIIIAALGCWFAHRIENLPLRINAWILSALGMLIALFAQLTPNNNFGFELDIHPISMTITALAWIAIAAVPSTIFINRATTAALATLSALIALAKLDQTLGTPEMLLAQSIALAVLIALAKRFYAWSLNEIASGFILVLAAGWMIHQLDQGSEAIESAPILRVDSLAVLAILITLLWSERTIRSRSRASDAPPNLHNIRQSLSTISLATLWFLFLAASTLEVVRATRMIFDAGSARGASISIWWSIYAIASVAAGFKLHKALRWSGLTLIAIVAAKVLLIDTMTLAAPARVVAAITVGMIIIATGVLYTRLVAATEDQQANQPDDEPDARPNPQPTPDQHDTQSDE